nr:PREDICTED: uncharacterized protein LOC109037206 isoform X1 [Bemisia tabaci]
MEPEAEIVVKTRKRFHEMTERGKRKHLTALAEKQSRQLKAARNVSNIFGSNESCETHYNYDADIEENSSLNEEASLHATEISSDRSVSDVDAVSNIDESDSNSDFLCASEDSEAEIINEEAFYDTFVHHSAEEAFRNLEQDRSLNILQLLIQWALLYKVKMNALSALLKLLRQFPNFSHIPNDARTLLKTPVAEKAEAIDDGQYYHFGLMNSLTPGLKHIPPSMTKLKLILNFDGLPLFKSTDSQFWPILVSILGLGQVFMAGLYHGYSKPADAEKYLSKFIEELKALIKSGVLLPDGRVLPVEVFCVCCDAPAKSFILGCKGHTGYWSCTRCTQKGEWIGGKVVFLETNAPPRTHDDFLKKTDSNFHHKASIFESVTGINMTSSFCLDFMHVVLLGVQRKMLKLWVLGTVPFKLGSTAVFQCSQQLYGLRAYIPSEFCRKPRHLDLIKRWKATELRQFLLYTGPVVLKSVLEKKKYENFLVLSVAMRILLCPTLVLQDGFIQYARQLLLNFVEAFKILYGTQFITHNFHNLIHLADDAERFGHLNLVSAFKFENFLQVLKNMVRKPSDELMQVIRRLGERFASESQRPIGDISKSDEIQLSGKECAHGVPYDDLCQPHYSSITIKGFLVSTKKSDACVGTSDGKIVVVEGVSYSPRRKGLVIVGRYFIQRSEFFTSPCYSSLVGIYKVGKLSPVRCWPVTTIKMKYVLLPLRSEFVALPLLHSD